MHQAHMYFPLFLQDPPVVCLQKARDFRDRASLVGADEAKPLIHMAEQFEAMSIRLAENARRRTCWPVRVDTVSGAGRAFAQRLAV